MFEGSHVLRFHIHVDGLGEISIGVKMQGVVMEGVLILPVFHLKMRGASWRVYFFTADQSSVLVEEKHVVDGVASNYHSDDAFGFPYVRDIASTHCSKSLIVSLLLYSRREAEKLPP